MRRDRATSMGFALVALASAALACKASPPKPELFGVFRGCTEIKADRTCLYTSGSTLTVWFDASASSEVEVEIDGDEVATKLIPAEDGARLELPLEDHAERVRVDMTGGRFELPLKWVETATPAEPGPREAYRLHQAGLRALRRGDAEKARALLVDAEGRARASGADHRLREIAYPLTYIDVTMLGELGAAETRRQSLPDPPSYDGRALVFMGWLRGYVAWRLGDRRTAHRQLDEAIKWGRRVNSPARLDAASLQGLLLLESGRASDAIRVFDQLRASPERTGCAWVTDTLNAGWARLAMRQPEEIVTAGNIFKATSDALESSCLDDVTRNHQLINLALTHLELDDADGTLSWLSQVHGHLDPVLDFWVELLEARLALLQRRPSEAARMFVRLADEAQRSRVEGLSWRARLGAGRAHLAAEEFDSAIQQLKAAEHVLERQAHLMPAHEGRFSWLDQREDSARELVGLLLDRGATEEAFEAARRARRRALLTLASTAELNKLLSGSSADWGSRVAAFEEARRALTLHRSNTAWATPDSDVSRMDAKERSLAAEVDRRMDEALELLRPVSRRLSVAFSPETLVVLPARTPTHPVAFTHLNGVTSVRPSSRGILDVTRGSSRVPRRVLFLATEPRDAATLSSALVTTTPVAFGLDLGSDGPHRGSRKNRLLVSDPRGDLEGARTEAKTIEDLWASALLHLSGRRATRSAVVDALEGADYFHYAGHGRSAGAEGWDSALLLADSELTVGDILFLKSVPRIVVLSGCETAKTGDGHAGGIGLAQAFLVAGSEAVIATHRPVPSDQARAYAVALHQALAREGIDIYEAHRAAIQTVGDAADAFVLLVR